MSREPSQGAEHLAVVLSRILRAGVAIAAALVLIGTVILLWTRGGKIADYRAFRGESLDLGGAAGALRSARQVRPGGIIEVGLLVLVATPVARVVVAALAFAHQRDRLYALIALIVLSGLLFGLLGPYF